MERISPSVDVMIELGPVIGRGQFGRVLKGKWDTTEGTNGKSNPQIS